MNGSTLNSVIGNLRLCESAAKAASVAYRAALGPKLTERQAMCLSGLPVDGSFEERGSAYYYTYCALESRGLVKRRRQGNGFAWARVTT